MIIHYTVSLVDLDCLFANYYVILATYFYEVIYENCSS